MSFGSPGAADDGRPEPPRNPGGGGIGPEAIALVLSLVVALTVGGGVLAGVRLPGAAAASPAVPSASSASRPTPTPGPSVNAAAVAVCLQIDARLIADREALAAEIAAKPFEASNVAAILRGANADLVQAIDIAAHLGPTSAALALSRDLSAFYSDLHTMISDGLVNSVQNGPAYLALAKAVAGALAKVERFDTRLSALLQADSPPPVAASASPAAGSPPPSATPVPASVPPTATPVPPPSGSAGPAQSAGPPPVNPAVAVFLRLAVGQRADRPARARRRRDDHRRRRADRRREARRASPPSRRPVRGSLLPARAR